ncbi:unnamed protein product [Adineta ricciae]|uniref:Uncharacterized protein n=1 Tax=Adineta ricciae TaxID=249248 RepID=A0A815W908_ADIRI|nr:unnamed protein product [Adineta ricciae]CAF1541847.1 unnamed protein product [Adineta ricciae]
MKTSVHIKDEPVELQVNELLRLYGYNLTDAPKIKPSRTKSTVTQDQQEASTCAWCQKLGGQSFTLRTDNGDSKTLCSEVCFNQYRRASFKKNRVAENETDHIPSSIISTNKSKSPEKKNGLSKSDQQLLDANRRKLLLPLRHLTPIMSKTKSNRFTRKSTPSPFSKRHRSSSSPHSNEKILRTEQPSTTPSNLPVNLAWQPSLFLPSTMPWSSPIDINRFQYHSLFAPPPLPPISAPLPPPPPPPPPPPVLPVPSHPVTSSNLFSTLTKGALSNYTCILPSFIPLPIPIPIPLCFPVRVPCTKCSVEVNHQHSQTTTENDAEQKRLRRMSI